MSDPATALPPPSDEPITARLAGAGSLRREIEALLAAAPTDPGAAGYRRLILDANATGKSSVNARMWMWKRLKLRYALDAPGSPEHQAYRWAMAQAATPAERGLISALMLARTDRLFREVVTEQVAPLIRQRGKTIDGEVIREAVARRMHEADLAWSAKSVANIANHILSSLKDFGIVEGSRQRRISGINITHIVATFAAMLGRAQGLTDRQLLDSSWFQFLGVDTAAAAEGLHSAARAGLVTFRMQADVVELRLPDLGEAT